MSQATWFDTDELQLIAFKLGNEEYAVPIMSVQEIIMPEKTTKMPQTPDYVEGVINLRGKIIPIIDGRKRFGFNNAELTGDTRIMVFELEKQTLGLIVDSVSEVVHLKSQDVEPPPVEVSEGQDYLKGIGKFNNRLLILLNPEKCFDAKQLESIKNLMQVSKEITAVKEEAPVVEETPEIKGKTPIVEETTDIEEIDPKDS
jgi:purine-binding chemotaxis protein CheW